MCLTSLEISLTIPNICVLSEISTPSLCPRLRFAIFFWLLTQVGLKIRTDWEGCLVVYFLKGKAVDGVAVGVLKVGSRNPHNAKSERKVRSIYRRCRSFPIHAATYTIFKRGSHWETVSLLLFWGAGVSQKWLVWPTSSSFQISFRGSKYDHTNNIKDHLSTTTAPYYSIATTGTYFQLLISHVINPHFFCTVIAFRSTSYPQFEHCFCS